MPGSSRFESDPDDRKISTEVSGEKVSGHSCGPSGIEPLRDDGYDLRVVYSRTGRWIGYGSCYIIYGNIRVN